METETTTSTSDDNDIRVAGPAQHPTTARPLEYDQKTRQVTRGQMRFFLLLLTINTFLFGAFICLPLASPFLKKIWEDHQAQREQKREVAAEEEKQKREAAKIRGLIDACMKYTAPADEVIYAEAPPDVAKLLAVAGRAYLTDRTLTLEQNGAEALRIVGWQPPAARQATDPLAALIVTLGQSSEMSVLKEENSVFLHEMISPGGNKRLVCVTLNDTFRSDAPDVQGYQRYDVHIDRHLTAYVFDQDAANPVKTSAFIRTSAAELVLLINNSADVKVELQKHGEWRIFAGQPDKADASHFTIAYDIDGKPGVIDGRLTDADRLMLQPRVGRLNNWTSGEEYVWDLTAPAATQPIK